MLSSSPSSSSHVAADEDEADALARALNRPGGVVLRAHSPRRDLEVGGCVRRRARCAHLAAEPATHSSVFRCAPSTPASVEQRCPAPHRTAPQTRLLEEEGVCAEATALSPWGLRVVAPSKPNIRGSALHAAGAYEVRLRSARAYRRKVWAGG